MCFALNLSRAQHGILHWLILNGWLVITCCSWLVYCMQSVDQYLETRTCAKYTQGGDTALTCAAVRNHIDCVRLLIDHGADKEVKNLVRQKGYFMLFILHS